MLSRSWNSRAVYCNCHIMHEYKSNCIFVYFCLFWLLLIKHNLKRTIISKRKLLPSQSPFSLAAPPNFAERKGVWLHQHNAFVLTSQKTAAQSVFYHVINQECNNKQTCIHVCYILLYHIIIFIDGILIYKIPF